MIHRDVKPSNILLTPEGAPKVTDFGLARIEDALALSRTGDFAGTPYYMSPEQAASRRIGIDHRTDIFSLGATLYEMLTLKLPFEGDTSQQVLRKILLEDPPDPRKLRSRTPRDLAVICLKAMEKRPDHRYQSMEELSADLRRFTNNEPIVAKPPGPIARGVKWVRRHPVVSVAGAVAVVALLVISGLWWRATEAEQATAAALTRIKEEKAATAAERDRAIAAEKTAKQLSYYAFLRSTQDALNANNFAEARRTHELCPEEYREWEWHHLALRLDQSLQTLKGHENGVDSVAWNPTGTRIVSGSGDNTLRVWATATTGECVQTLTGHENGVTSVAWNPTGTRIVSAEPYGVFRIWDAATGDCIQTVTGNESYVSSLDWNPAGTLIVSGALNRTVRVWDASNGRCVQTLAGHESGVTSVAWNPSGTRIASGSYDSTIRIWDAATGQCVQTITGHDDMWGGISVAWNPAGTRIVSGSYDKTLRVWDASTGKCTHTLTGHEKAVYSVAWNPAGTRIVSGSDDETVRVWDTLSGECVQTLRGHVRQVSSVAWNPSGTRIVSVSDNGIVLIWESDFEQARAMRHGAERRRRLQLIVDELFKEHLFLEPVMEALGKNPNLDDTHRTTALRMANAIGNSYANSYLLDLNGKARSLVNPFHEHKTKEAVHVLRLARAAVSIEPGDCMILDTYAWALFANGLYNKAIAASKRTIELDPGSKKVEYLWSFCCLRVMVEKATGTEHSFH